MSPEKNRETNPHHLLCYSFECDQGHMCDEIFSLTLLVLIFALENANRVVYQQDYIFKLTELMIFDQNDRIRAPSKPFQIGALGGFQVNHDDVHMPQSADVRMRLAFA